MGRATGVYDMTKSVGISVGAALLCGVSLAPWAAVAATDDEKAAMKQTTATCKAQVKDYAKYNETSWWQRHKMAQKCVKDALAKK
jgi:hypothetical protein